VTHAHALDGDEFDFGLVVIMLPVHKQGQYALASVGFSEVMKITNRPIRFRIILYRETTNQNIEHTCVL